MKKVVIIGAGPTGLTAAWQLSQQESEPYEIIILEASEYIGGMAKTVVYNGNRLDIGGHRFFSKEKKVLEWWKKIMSETEDSMSSFMLCNRKTSIYYQQKFFDYPIQMNIENIKKLGIKEAFQIAGDYFKVCITPLREVSLEHFYINRFGKKLYSMFFEEYTKKLCGVHSKEISPKWGEQRVRGLSIKAILSQRIKLKRQIPEPQLSADFFYYPKYGPGELWQNVAEQAEKNGVTIRTNCPVIGVHQENGKIDFVTIKTSLGEERIEGDVFISTMPMRELIGAMNLVPKEIAEVAESLPYRAFVTIGMLVDSLLTEKSNCWIYVQDRDVKVGRIQFYDNWSPFLAKENKGKFFVALEYFCNEGDDFWNMSEEECFTWAVKEAIQLGIFPENVKVSDWHRERIKQAYPGYYGAYKDIDKVRDYLASIENLFSIGRNGQHEYWNMDRCMVSAWEVAEKIKENNCYFSDECQSLR